MQDKKLLVKDEVKEVPKSFKVTPKISEAIDRRTADLSMKPSMYYRKLIEADLKENGYLE